MTGKSTFEIVDFINAVYTAESSIQNFKEK